VVVATVAGTPGRPKTDKLDAVWLAKVVERGMCAPSFVPPQPIRRLRDLTRYRRSLIRDRTREKQRLEKLLDDAQIKMMPRSNCRSWPRTCSVSPAGRSSPR
jgi:transposase